MAKQLQYIYQKTNWFHHTNYVRQTIFSNFWCTFLAMIAARHVEWPMGDHGCVPLQWASNLYVEFIPLQINTLKPLHQSSFSHTTYLSWKLYCWSGYAFKSNIAEYYFQ